MRWELVKELRKTIMQYGIASPFTRSLLQTAMKCELMTPFDTLALDDLIFTPTQKVFFKVHWREACDAAALENLGRQLGDPLG